MCVCDYSLGLVDANWLDLKIRLSNIHHLLSALNSCSWIVWLRPSLCVYMSLSWFFQYKLDLKRRLSNIHHLSALDVCYWLVWLPTLLCVYVSLFWSFRYKLNSKRLSKNLCTLISTPKLCYWLVCLQTSLELCERALVLSIQTD